MLQFMCVDLAVGTLDRLLERVSHVAGLPAAPARSDVMEQSSCCVCGRFMRMEIVKVSSRHRGGGLGPSKSFIECCVAPAIHTPPQVFMRATAAHMRRICGAYEKQPCMISIAACTISLISTMRLQLTSERSIHAPDSFGIMATSLAHILSMKPSQ